MPGQDAPVVCQLEMTRSRQDQAAGDLYQTAETWGQGQDAVDVYQTMTDLNHNIAYVYQTSANPYQDPEIVVNVLHPTTDSDHQDDINLPRFHAVMADMEAASGDAYYSGTDPNPDLDPSPFHNRRSGRWRMRAMMAVDVRSTR